MSKTEEPTVPPQEQVFEWKDEESGAEGWIFIDTVINGQSYGPLLVGLEVTREDVLFAAKQASLISTVCSPQTGGGAAGIRLPASASALPSTVPNGFDDESRLLVLTRFVRAHRALLSNALVLSGATDAELLALDEAMRRNGLSGAVHALASHFAGVTEQPDLGDSFVHKLRVLSAKVNFCELAHAFGIGQIINCLQEITPLASKPRVVIDGFGSLGSSLAYFIDSMGIGSVVAIRDGAEHISRLEGLPIAEILHTRVERKRRLVAKKQFSRMEESKLLCYLDEVQLKRFSSSSSTLLSVEAEVIILCTEHPVLDTLPHLEALLTTLSGKGAHFLFPAYPLTKAQDAMLDSDKGREMLDAHKCSHVPHWVCVAGRDQIVKSLATIPFDFKLPSPMSTVLDSISLPVTRFTQEAYYTFSQKNILLFGHPACLKKAQHKMENPVPMAVIVEEKRKLPVEVFNDGERMQHNIERMGVKIKTLVHSLLEDYDSIVLMLFDDLLQFFVMQQLEIVYLTEDTGERPAKRTAVVAMEAIDKFFRACCAARKELAAAANGDKSMTDSPQIFFQYVKKQRPEEAVDNTESKVAGDAIKRFNVPFSAKTLSVVCERVVNSNALLVIIDVLLSQAVAEKKGEKKKSDSDKDLPPAPSVGSQEEKSTEKHPDELGRALGGVLSSAAELAELPALLQFGLSAFLFLGGKGFLGRQMDGQFEPSIYEDINSVDSAIKIVKAARAFTPEQAEHAEERIQEKLNELIPSIPFTGDLPAKVVRLLHMVISNPDMLSELLYVYLLPALIRQRENDQKRDLTK